MMKANKIKLLGFGLAAGLALTSCSDSFLEDKRNYDNVGPEIYDDYDGCKARLNDVYAWCLPDINETAGNRVWKSPSTGRDDDQAKSTEEYSGFSCYVDPQTELMSDGDNRVPDYFCGQISNIQEAVYGRIRNINDVIRGVNGGSISQEQKNEILGQLYFFRAWCYYSLLKFYGGVPIVTEVVDPEEGIVFPRATTKQTVDFILSDLDTAAKLLGPFTMNGGWGGSDYGRVTTGTALALKGRVLLLWASPLFNRKDAPERWTNAYNLMKLELDSINACGYGLYNEANNINGSSFANMFNQRTTTNPEAVFVTLYNQTTTGDGQKNNSWERWIRPANTTGSGFRASAMLVDLFPMADGKVPTTAQTYTKLDRSEYEYDREHPFMNRDPRFYRTFAMPGFRWAYKGDGSVEQPNDPKYNNGQDYELWNYVWYTSAEDRDNPASSNSYGADNFLAHGTGTPGVYVRKRSDDLDVNPNPLYTNFNAESQNGGFAYSAQPYMEIRYAEVLLNLAEAACGANQMAEAVSYLQQIRARAGYTAANNYGLDADLAGNKAKCMSAILYERQIEFAYEGKRFDDMRRWMLFDGGTGKVAGAPSSWDLTGWTGNTCDWLGFKPLNGQRRENIEFRVSNAHNNGLGGTTYGSDPFDPSERCEAVDLRQELDPQLETLKTWYDQYLVRKDKKGDGRDINQIDLYINFRPKYYLLGFNSSAQGSNSALPQTIGWDDFNNGGAPGTFDPLAE